MPVATRSVPQPSCKRKLKCTRPAPRGFARTSESNNNTGARTLRGWEMFWANCMLRM
eukprot:CAMPEP_0194511130 /NCGR_PEP_ID=MMETSP0253-20130528/42714_1 /TAXON_ID=2966 /ORGANISM="Noctiluca scintillans" /LENGTH=56 /DNA_ID=CAMNT_0039354441 /DNA_START=159 /DNA_END=329 /DNA_ORIENTATION=-